MRKIQTENGTIYVSDAEYQAHQLIQRIGWRQYCALMNIEPDCDRKARASRLRSLGFDRQTIAHCLGISRARLWELLQRTPEQKARRNEYSRRWMKEHYQPKVREGLKPSEVAATAGVSSGLVRLWIREGRLPAENVSGGKTPRYRVRREDLDRFLSKRNEAKRRKTKPQNRS